MKLESVGILIELRPFRERDALARIFTRDHGVLAGMMRGAQVARKNKPLTGQVGPVAWNARLDSQLGVFHWEAERNLAAPLMSDAEALGLMNSAFALLSALLPEREKYESLWLQTEAMLGNIGAYVQRLENHPKHVRPPSLHRNASRSDSPSREELLEYSELNSPLEEDSQSASKAQRDADAGLDGVARELYLSWEVGLLRELGYALDLARCSGCGRTEGLTHLSPRTARAVCETCAAPYLDRLHPLPVGLGTTEKFLRKIMTEQGGRELPLARKLVL
jgi:recombinational DNA repair protein (RecF pathway)